MSHEIVDDDSRDLNVHRGKLGGASSFSSCLIQFSRSATDWFRLDDISSFVNQDGYENFAREPFLAEDVRIFRSHKSHCPSVDNSLGLHTSGNLICTIISKPVEPTPGPCR